jgi:hypothetical protein
MPIDPTELQDFCVDSGYNVRLERSGTFFTPPSFNVHMTDWERAARLRYLPTPAGIADMTSAAHDGPEWECSAQNSDINLWRKVMILCGCRLQGRTVQCAGT